MEEFAAAVGLSRPTVSKYFFDPTSVRPRTRARIEEALERHDYRPNIYAINQNRRLTRTIGVIVPFLADPFFAEISRLIERLCIDAGFRPIVFSSHGEPQLEADNLRSLLALKPAGALLAPLGRLSDHDAIASFCDAVPSILFDSNIEAMGGGFVGSDNEQSIGEIVRYLCASGQPPCFFEGRLAPNPNVEAKLAAYTGAMRSLGHEPHIVYADGEGWDFEAIGYRSGRKALRERAFPTNTVLCGNDRLAMGFLAAAYEEGLRVGRGEGCALRVAGHDDHPFSRFTCPPLTTVAQDFGAIAARSVGLLTDLFDSDAVRFAERTTTLFEGRLVIRASA